ncbi:hypothetical protein STAFG_0826 [Streptomyces afghaniensis 772]|uniref:Uncharacterized protein n=1 Tax=Streptomyces afghaniensis 772 TaxID=1283301 RepID=S4N3D9_9ACTN|nr:hypothetical protein STAFG_0826 [Streptomyces afghaniensis 772]
MGLGRHGLGAAGLADPVVRRLRTVRADGTAAPRHRATNTSQPAIARQGCRALQRATRTDNEFMPKSLAELGSCRTEVLG